MTICVVAVNQNDDTEVKAEEQIEAYIYGTTSKYASVRTKSPRISNLVCTFWLQDEGEGVKVKMAEWAFAIPGDQFTLEHGEHRHRMRNIENMTGIMSRSEILVFLYFDWGSLLNV